MSFIAVVFAEIKHRFERDGQQQKSVPTNVAEILLVVGAVEIIEVFMLFGIHSTNSSQTHSA